MIPVKMTDGVFSLRANHWDRKLFDELAPLPDGTSYNSYLVRGGEKTALIDTVYPPKTAEFIAALKKTGVERLDYIVANHAELDHSGSIPAVLALFPEAKVVANARCWRMMGDLMALDRGRFLEAKDGQRLSLGGKTLRFVFMPWVHWPETMGVFLEEDRIFFPCDFLGAHLATSELYAGEEAQFETAAKRYYAEIMAPYRLPCRNALARTEELDPQIVAPSHGPVHAKPRLIMDLYRRWTSDAVKPEVAIVYVSMYQSTTAMVERLIDRLMEKGLPVRLFNAVDLDTGALSMALVDASTVVFASPTVLTGPHPALAYAAVLVNALAPKTRFAAMVGSYGWGTTMPDALKETLREFKATFFDPVLTKGAPTSQTFAELDALAEAIAAANASLGESEQAAPDAGEVRIRSPGG
jgi:flavorubredoxin